MIDGEWINTHEIVAFYDGFGRLAVCGRSGIPHPTRPEVRTHDWNVCASALALQPSLRRPDLDAGGLARLCRRHETVRLQHLSDLAGAGDHARPADALRPR